MASIMLFGWPIVVMLLFSRLPPQRALAWSLLAAYLFLAPGYEVTFPGIGFLNKPCLPSISAGLAIFIMRDQIFRDAPPPPLGAFVKLIILLSLVTPICTSLTNPDHLIEGRTFRPGITLTYGINEVLRAIFDLLPFLLGYLLLGNLSGARVLLKVLVAGMLAYSVLMLVEVRLSPQVNVWVYGYFQHDFGQTMRYGGFRPIVFLQHPLWVASITMMALLAAITIYRTERGTRRFAIMIYMIFTLIICKSAGAIFLALCAGPFLMFARPRTVIRVAVIAATLAFAYPILRAFDLLPLKQIVDFASSISVDRGASLAFRLYNEKDLMDRAMLRPLFGWGGNGRGLILDPGDGRLVSIPDGLWVIWLGSTGIVGYISHYLPMVGSIWALAWAERKPGPSNEDEKSLLLPAGLALMLAMNLIDLIPNATMTPITALIAGAVMGNARKQSAKVKVTTKSTVDARGLNPLLT